MATATKRQGEGNSQAKKGTENESGSEVERWVAGGCGAPSTPVQPEHGCGPGCPPSCPMAWARGNTCCRAPSPMAGGPQGHTGRVQQVPSCTTKREQNRGTPTWVIRRNRRGKREAAKQHRGHEPPSPMSAQDTRPDLCWRRIDTLLSHTPPRLSVISHSPSSVLPNLGPADAP